MLRFSFQLQKYQETDRVKRSSRSHKVASAWSIVCAIELGLLQKSSLKDVTIASYLDLDFLRTKKDAERFSDFEANNHEDVVSDRTSANIYDGSWPFIDPARIMRITSRKSVRKRGKRRRWSTKRQRKLNVDKTRCDINDETTNLSIKRAASSSPEDIRRENLGVSNGGPTGLSENKFSLTQLHARWSDRDEDENRERLSGSYGSADEDEGVCRAMSETSSSEIIQIDYSGAGYSKFYTSNCQKKESQNRTELSEYPDYFSNVLRIDDDNDNLTTEDDNFNTTPDWDNYNTRSMKFAKFTEHVPREITTRTSVKNGNTLGNIGRRSSRKKSRHLKRSESRLKELLKERSNKLMRRKKKSGNSVTNNDYNLRISRDLEESSPECKSDARGSFGADTRDTVKIARGRCDCNFTNAACTCKRNLKSTATAIMRDIQAHIRSAEIDVENILRDFAISADSLDEKPGDKDLNRDISMEYDWIGLENNDDLGEISPQKSKQLFDLAKLDPTESFIDISMKRRRRKKRLNRYTIDCKFVDRTETAYRSVFHECVDFDSPVATSSLKINMDESWRSEDNDSGVDMIHSSWRRSVSFIQDCDNELDSALLLARKIISDDSTKGEKYYDDEHETLESTCYKYHETADVYAISRDTSLHDSCSDEEDAKFVNQHDKTKNIITYKKKGRNIWRLSSMDRNFVKNGIDKVNNI